MPIYFVRHAKAGQRDRWDGPDEIRPLSGKGRKQAVLIAERLLDAPISGLWSSPYVRCMQTLEPLGEKIGLPVQESEELAEGNPFEPVLEQLARVPDHAVLCSHGDILPATIDALVRRGMRVKGEPDWRKGVLWVLDRDGSGAITRARVEPPPAP